MPDSIKTIKIQDKAYPNLLRQISHPPKAIYYRGDINLDKPSIAIVGTRDFSIYGKQVTLDLVRDLASLGFIIVSGLARGIDSFAHQATLLEKGKTIAVLGTGIDDESIYPRQNLNLAHRIIESGGAIISEFPPRTKVTKYNFPKRNRIISGLSLGVVVIEAKEKSGALITAEWARKQKRKVMAIPGSIYSSNSKGTNELIKKGGLLVREAKDVAHYLGFHDLKKISQNIIRGENQEEEKIIQLLNQDALHIEEIIQKTKSPASVVISHLSELEIKGKVIDLGGNIYTLNR